ncbi:MAG: tetratricopeptide repeat-containing sensor histidine kinase [Sphingobacteriales bacterium]|nr:MAG: tetratricopeptide repeat-containing sensor histidine kinase [Sphingobacteriales bacterium]
MSIRHLSLLTYFVIFCVTATHAQPKEGRARLDSLLLAVPHMTDDSARVMLMDKISIMYFDINPDSGIIWAKKELRESEKMGFAKGMMHAYTSLGTNYNCKGNYTQALSSFFKGLHLAEEKGTLRNRSVFLTNIGSTYAHLGQYEKALPYQLQALKMMQQSKDLNDIQYLYLSIGSTYGSLKDFSKAMEYYKIALQIVEESGSKEGISNVAGNMGLIYDEMKMHNTALVYKYWALRCAEDIGDLQLIAINKGSVGETYLTLATDTAAQIIPDSLVPAGHEANLSRAVYYLREGIETSRDAHFPEYIPEFYLNLSKAYTAQGNFKAALETYQQSVAASDSMKAIASKKEVQQLESQRQLQLKDKDIQIAKLAVVQKRNERAFFVSGIALLLIIMGILIYNFRSHVRSRQRIKELQDHKISLLDEAVKRRTEQLGSMRQTIATDFHDQTGNMLAAITRQAGMLELKLLSQPEVLPMVRSIINNSNELYASSKDFLWNLNHDSNDPVVLFQYLSGYGQRFYNQFDISFSAVVKGTANVHMQLQHFAGLNIIYIFKEAMSNVVKHSGADQVNIELRWEANRVTYALQDNGIWKDADNKTEHYGLANMQRRSRQSSFEYNLSHEQNGTRIEITVPLSADFITSPTNNEPQTG